MVHVKLLILSFRNFVFKCFVHYATVYIIPHDDAYDIQIWCFRI